jgi:transposase
MADTYVLTGYDDDNNVIVDHLLTADQAIRILAAALAETKKAVQVEEPEDEPPVVKTTRKTKAAPAQRAGKIDKDGILKDLIKGMKPRAIAMKRAIDVQAVYNIKSQAKKDGLINRQNAPSVKARRIQESEVFDEATREQIKDMRARELTTSEIAAELDLDRDDVAKVMARKALQ